MGSRARGWGSKGTKEGEKGEKERELGNEIVRGKMEERKGIKGERVILRTKKWEKMERGRGWEGKRGENEGWKDLEQGKGMEN